MTTATTPSKRKRDWVKTFLIVIRVMAIVVISWGVAGTVSHQIGGTGPSGAAWRDLLIAGIAQGSMYGLIALGYSMVYGVLGFINFAHGEVFMSGAMVGFFGATALFANGMWEEHFLTAIFIVLVISILTSILVAVIVERVAYRRLRDSPRLIPLITSIGISFFLQYTFFGLFGPAVRSYPAVPPSLAGKINFLWFIPIDGTKLVVIIVAFVSMVALHQFVNRTKTGKAMRAVAEDKEIAALMGINVDRIVVTTFAVGGAMAGIAAVLWAILFRGVSFITGFLPGIKAFTAAVLGGIGNLAGAMVGGVTLGIFEGVGPQLILGGLNIPGFSRLKDVVAFSALVLVLIFRPSGLLGERLNDDDRA